MSTSTQGGCSPYQPCLKMQKGRKCSPGSNSILCMPSRYACDPSPLIVIQTIYNMPDMLASLTFQLWTHGKSEINTSS